MGEIKTNRVTIPIFMSVLETDLEAEMTIEFEQTEGGVHILGVRINDSFVQLEEVDIMLIEADFERFFNGGF